MSFPAVVGVLASVPTGVLASTPKKPDPTKWIGPGLLGFVVIVALGVATFLLWRNMNKQLKKVTFDEGDGPGDGVTDGSDDGGDGTDGENRHTPANAPTGHPVGSGPARK